jgi:hypothetical protein
MNIYLLYMEAGGFSTLDKFFYNLKFTVFQVFLSIYAK